MNKFLYTGLILILFVGISSAQDQFDRFYRPIDRSMQAIDMKVSESGNYILMSHFIEDDTTGKTGINLTKLNPKGNLDWSKDFVMEDTILTEITGQLHLTADEYIYFNTVICDEENGDNKVLFSLDSRGDLMWANRYMGLAGDTTLKNPIQLEAISDTSVLQIGSQVDTLGQGIYATRLDNSGNIMWSKTWQYQNGNGDDINEVNHDILFTADSNIVTIGKINTSAFRSDGYMTKMDTLGNIEWSRSFSNTDTRFSLVEPSDIAQLNDSTYVVSGSVKNSLNDASIGFICLTDDHGNILWSKSVSIDVNLSTVVNNIVEAADGNFYISGSSYNNVDSVIQDYVCEIDTLSGAVWQNSFRAVDTFYRADQIDFDHYFDSGALAKIEDNGLAYFTFGKETVDDTTDKVIPRLIKMNDMGMTSCEDSIVTNILFDLVLEQDTAIWIASVMDSVRELNHEAIGFGTFDIPVLTLPDTTFCPGDPVMFLIDATTDGAVSYEWTTADAPDNIIGTDSTYLATEVDVDYVVNIRIEDELCMTLCDTTRLSDIDPPSVSLSVDYSAFCNDPNNKIILINAQAQGNIQSVMWSTNEMNVSQIQVNDTGTYSVTVTNECGDTGDATVTINEAELPQPNAIQIAQDNSDVCNGNIILTIQNANSLSDILWNNGAATTQIVVTEPGDYSVSALDFCLRNTGGSINVSTDAFYQEGAIESLTIDTDNCTLDRIPVFLTTSGDVATIDWSNGEMNTNAIIESTPGNYGVTVTDICGATVEDNINAFCGSCPDGTFSADQDNSCLCFPNAFAPNLRSQVEDDPLLENQNFGPINNCGAVDNYELHIYNRWGQQVFETNTVGELWNGTKGTSPAPAEVYIFYAKYSLNGEEFSHKGDVTLIR